MSQSKQFCVGATKLRDIEDKVQIRENAFKLLDMFGSLVPPLKNARVMVKINLCLLLGPETGATVDPKVVRYFVEWLFEKRAPMEVIIAEADATHMSADIAYKALGWEKFFGDMGNVRFLNLSKDKRISVNSRCSYIKDLKMSETYMTCDWLVSFAKLKAHTKQLITCTMKNIFGAIPEKVKFVYHPRLTDAICDANSARQPDFGFIDGLVAMENDGPTKGTPRRTGILLAGNNIVSLDHYATKMMGFNPQRVPHVKMAMSRGLGSDTYRILDRSVEPCNPSFAFMPRWKQMVRWGVEKIRKE